MRKRIVMSEENIIEEINQNELKSKKHKKVSIVKFRDYLF